ncbi:hypothetical protein ACWDN6_18990 [Streptomyces albogriseolus]|uniref:hypothetical protein n=1 Tax=Streptomyces sp. CL7 TaxID=3096006 RepID=UPI002A75CCFE|nr:hypothetical protein [Streptomyces sp. CL7]WPP32947.1 hypothetical protein SJH97_28050 [Streptomyces sp. CL7]
MGGVRGPRRSPVVGAALLGLGRTTRFLGFALGAGAGSGLAHAFFVDPGPDAEDIHWSVRVLLVVVVPFIGWLLFAAGRRLVVRGARHRAPVIESFEQLRGERYLLYLRPFDMDRRMAEPPPEAPGGGMRSPFEMPGHTTEDFVLGQFSGLGEVVAVGRPGEELPLLGARRGYLPLEDWKAPVSALLQGAHTVLLSVAPGPGTEWEFTEALRTVAPERLVLMVACGAGEYDTFRRAVAALYSARRRREGGSTWAPLPGLPDCPAPPPGGKRQWVLPVRAFITFDREWRPTVFPFVVRVPWLRHLWTVRRLIRGELHPLLARIGGLPARGAVDIVPPPRPAGAPPDPSRPAAPPSVVAPRQPLLGSVHVPHQQPPRKRWRGGRRRRS